MVAIVSPATVASGCWGNQNPQLESTADCLSILVDGVELEAIWCIVGLRNLYESSRIRWGFLKFEPANRVQTLMTLWWNARSSRFTNLLTMHVLRSLQLVVWAHTSALYLHADFAAVTPARTLRPWGDRARLGRRIDELKRVDSKMSNEHILAFRCQWC